MRPPENEIVNKVCDENSAWRILCEDLSGRPFARMAQSKYCVVDEEVKQKFRCVGISVLDASYPESAQSHEAKSYARVSVSGIRMWERRN